MTIYKNKKQVENQLKRLEKKLLKTKGESRSWVNMYDKLCRIALVETNDEILIFDKDKFCSTLTKLEVDK